MNKHLLIFAIVTASSVASAAEAMPVATEAVKMYQLDLFSIISFALAIAAFVISIFMGWLSWEFYKKSASDSEKTQQAVTKIETAVLSIQSEITEIVRRAVGYWTGSEETSDVVNQSSALTSKVEELASQIKSLSGASANKPDLDAKLAELVQLQKEQVLAFSNTVTDARVRALFPSVDRGPVSQVTISFDSNSENLKSGDLIINVLRPSKIATATCKFNPSFTKIPELKVELCGTPGSTPSKVHIKSGVGQNSDFNVHLISADGLLQTGEYVVKFIASLEPQLKT